MLMLLSLAGALLLLHITSINSLWDGALEMTPDSVQYVAAAQNILAGQDYLRYEGVLYTVWPPLYATIIALLYSMTRFVTTDVIHALRYFHVFLYMILIFASGLLFLRYIKSRAIALLGTAAVIVSPALYVSHLVWSEEIFALLIVVLLLALQKFLDAPSRRLVILNGVLAGLIVLQRYAGIVVVMSGGIMILFFLYRLPFWRRIGYAFIYGIISMTPISLWMLRNYEHTGQLAGSRSPSHLSLLENMGQTADRLKNWFIPHDPAALAPLLTVVLIIVFGIALMQHYRLRQEVGLLARLEQVVPLPVMVVVVFYASFLIVTLALYNQGIISLQYLMAIYIPVLVLLCSFADRVSSRPWGKRWTVPLAAVWIIAYVMPASLSEVLPLAQYCCPTAWRNSELIDWLEVHAGELRKPIYANTPLSQYRGVSVRDLPRQLQRLTQPLPNANYLPPDTKGMYVVWYNYHQHDTCPRCYLQKYTLDEYGSLFHLEPIVELDDGAVYLVTPKEPDS